MKKDLVKMMYNGAEFGRCEAGKFAIGLDGTLCVMRKNGDYVGVNAQGEVVNQLDMAIQVDGAFFQIPTLTSDLKAGDLINNPASPINYYVVKEVKEDGTISAININTASTSTLKPTVSVFNANKYVTKIVNVMADGFGQAGADTAKGFNPLLLMAMKDDSDTSIKDIMMLQAMSGQAGTDFAKNPMALIALLGDDSDVDPLTLMMLTQGQDGTNLMSNPLLLTSLLKDDKGDSKDLIKMMALTGGLGGQAGAINPMTMLALLK